jgi:hypothetical protein
MENITGNHECGAPANYEENEDQKEEAERFIFLFMSYASITMSILLVSLYGIGYLGPYAAFLCCGCGLVVGYFVKIMCGYAKRDMYLPL